MCMTNQLSFELLLSRRPPAPPRPPPVDSFAPGRPRPCRSCLLFEPCSPLDSAGLGMLPPDPLSWPPRLPSFGRRDFGRLRSPPRQARTPGSLCFAKPVHPGSDSFEPPDNGLLSPCQDIAPLLLKLSLLSATCDFIHSSCRQASLASWPAPRTTSASWPPRSGTPVPELPCVISYTRLARLWGLHKLPYVTIFIGQGQVPEFDCIPYAASSLRAPRTLCTQVLHHDYATPKYSNAIHCNEERVVSLDPQSVRIGRSIEMLGHIGG